MRMTVTAGDEEIKCIQSNQEKERESVSVVDSI